MESKDPFLTLLTAVTHLEVESLEVGPPNPTALPTLPPWQLVSFAIRYIDGLDVVPVLNSFLSASHSSLRPLSVEPRLWDLGTVVDLSPFLALRDLVVFICPMPE
jgi:hypothetical protein